MGMPYKLATLLYCFNERDEVLLLERAQEPNLGLWSPGGGKLHTDTGESPYACACREAQEELGVVLSASDLHLTGVASEHEGRFQFFPRAALPGLKLPQTDRESIWPWFWEHRGGYFAAHCHCHPDGRNEWTLEESLVAGRGTG
jgi:8-oxo-dGTP diphosphatase